MKINYKNTALSFLENPKDFSMHTPGEGYSKPLTKGEDYKLLYGLIDQFSEDGCVDYFNKNIQYVTLPFYDAYRKAEMKLKEVVMKTPIDDSGTLIIPHEHHTQTFFYRIKSAGNGDIDGIEAFIVMFSKTPKNDSYGLDVCVYLTMEEHEIMDFVWKGFVDQGRDMSWWIADLLLFKVFLEYAEVETKIIQGEKREHHLGVKYLNETKSKVQILDSTYFTTISRTEGFGVRGHFRFQPYGVGMKQTRLQWIDAFQKNGYTRKAKIISV